MIERKNRYGRARALRPRRSIFTPTSIGSASVTKSFKVDDRVSWNSEAGRVSGTIIRVHTHNFDVKGYTHHASMNAPQ